MSIDKDLLDRLMEGRSPGDLFGKTGILSELTKALAERALSDRDGCSSWTGSALSEAPEGQNRTLQPPQRQQPEDGDHRQREGGSGHPARPQRHL